ncbi:MAG: translation elongation factor 4 [Candidatus Desulfofervidaceae bacterium]|nr:translation elongation factor 4 [Candidatus Desulfofervidaceae bacterium]
MDIKKIRNFCIIAHVDHGKSTLADRILEHTGAVPPNKMRDQFLDRMDLERERGITIKAQTVRLKYKADDGKTYVLNLIDTPGHVDFSYEVSRSLAACEGALLLVDAAQGVEAQTVANVYLAIEEGLEIIPVINKIDLPSANPERVKKEIAEILGLDTSEAILTSAKQGVGVKEVLEAIVKRIPPPPGDIQAPLQALIFDSWFDPFQGVVALVRVVNGSLKLGQKIKLMSSGKIYEVSEIGVFTPWQTPVKSLGPGEVGYIKAGIKTLQDAKIGDTITEETRMATAPLAGFKVVRPVVYAGFYPSDPGEYEELKEALIKLNLNDSAFVFEPETSVALGFGFRCGFLGMLHMEIVQERLEREFGLSVVATAPSVIYKVELTDGTTIEIDNPAKLPPVVKINRILEPVIRAEIHVSPEFLGNVIKLCEERRGKQKELRFVTEKHVILTYELPFSDVITDFYDMLKSVSRGYASFDYEIVGYQASPLVKLDVLINGQPVDALSLIVHKDQAYYKGRWLVSRLKEVIPRQVFEVVIQAAIGGRVIARERIAPLRKDVTAKCYGGDITRKRKLLEKQKEGKKRLKQLGKVSIPQEAFLAVFSRDK